MPSIIEEIPMKLFEGVKEVYHLCRRRLQEYQRKVQIVHVADERVPICVIDNHGIREFGASSVVFRFQVFGEIDPDVLLRIDDTWIFHLHKYSLHGLTDLYVKNGLRYLVFIICNESDKRTIKGALFKLKHPWS